MAEVALKQRHFRKVKNTIGIQGHLLKSKLRLVKGKLSMHPEFNMPRRLRRLRFTSRNLLPIILPLPSKANIIGLLA
jgi:hypothetical protein